ncbi:MAG: hypothetical protein ABIN97_20870 [Ginsengibacter sp.]
MKPVTKAQLSKIHVLLHQLNLIEDKANIVNQFTNGRATSSKEMTLDEAKELIRHLSTHNPNERMRKKVFALAYVAGIIWGDTPEDKKMNGIKLDQFLKARGAVKKEINRMTKNELVKVVTQFEQIVKNREQTKANKATRSLLEELSIPVIHPSKARH